MEAATYMDRGEKKQSSVRQKVNFKGGGGGGDVSQRQSSLQKISVPQPCLMSPPEPLVLSHVEDRISP